jgi:4'-phosphopantetheinyl transferase
VLDGELHVWIVPLDLPTPEIERLHRLLSTDEQTRAGSFPLPPRKRRYVARQGAVREILAGYVGDSPCELQLTSGARGKPSLPGGPAFSVSDSDDLALVAVGASEVGVDVERVIERRATRRILPAARVAALTEFFEAWTAREATCKATGEGLFSSHPDGRDWRLWKLVPAPGYVATVAAGNRVRRVAVRSHR